MIFTLLAAALAAVLFLAMLGLEAYGFRCGRARAARQPESGRHGLGSVEGAVYGLLGLLIAFSFSGAASRYEHRRELIVDEANAVGTAYLRVDVLPPELQPSLRDRFRSYAGCASRHLRQASGHRRGPRRARASAGAPGRAVEGSGDGRPDRRRDGAADAAPAAQRGLRHRERANGCRVRPSACRALPGAGGPRARLRVSGRGRHVREQDREPAPHDRLRGGALDRPLRRHRPRVSALRPDRAGAKPTASRSKPARLTEVGRLLRTQLSARRAIRRKPRCRS